MPSNQKDVMLNHNSAMRYFRKRRNALLGGIYDCPNCLTGGSLNCTTKGKPGAFTFLFHCRSCGFTQTDKGNDRADIIDLYNTICDHIRRFDPVQSIPDQNFRVVKLLVTGVKMR